VGDEPTVGDGKEEVENAAGTGGMRKCSKA
jgi:hypothetical protein